MALGYPVTKRSKSYKQPHGGFLPVRKLTKIQLDDGKNLNEEENIHASLTGMAVDYLTRFMLDSELGELSGYALGTVLVETFEISLLGAKILDIMTESGEENINKAYKLLSNITGLDDASIICACKLSGFDVCYRGDILGYRPIEEINPDSETIENIRIMIERSLALFADYGPVVKSGFNMEGGYTEIVATGDGDYLTDDTLWDFKVTKREPNSKQTLQLLMYYLMGKHSVHKEFDSIEKLAIFNPRKNKIYYAEVSNIPEEVIKEVSEKVIGY